MLCSVVLLIFLDITVVIPFIRTLKKQRAITRTRPWNPTSTSTESETHGVVEEPLPYFGPFIPFLPFSPMTRITCSGETHCRYSSSDRSPRRVCPLVYKQILILMCVKMAKFYFRIYYLSTWFARPRQVRLSPITLACKELLHSACSLSRTGPGIVSTGQKISRDPRTQRSSCLPFCGTHCTSGTSHLNFCISILVIL